MLIYNKLFRDMNYIGVDVKNLLYDVIWIFSISLWEWNRSNFQKGKLPISHIQPTNLWDLIFLKLDTFTSVTQKWWINTYYSIQLPWSCCVPCHAWHIKYYFLPFGILLRKRKFVHYILFWIHWKTTHFIIWRFDLLSFIYRISTF